MPQRKPATRLEQLVVREPDEHTPNHDELIAAFVQQQVIHYLVERLHPPCVFFSTWMYQTALEVPIAQNERIIGFADMIITATRALRCHLYTGIGRPGGHIADRRRRDGHRDDSWHQRPADEPHECCQDVYWYLRGQQANGRQHGRKEVPDRLDIALEFKTNVTSVGQLLRQVNTYRAHRPADYYVVVTQGACPQRELLHTERIQVIERMSSTSWNTSLALPDVGG